ncbi:MAG TPA: 7-carboxy-7-deazaguanine synthase QueE [Candidatus Margulisiibacteriota bacterium]|nr:7-carboxy-7-deazaguanine synthase QueE [Candidatus Margulisiibacteriota bacterium]
MRPGYLSEIFVSFQGEGAHVGRRHLFVRLAGCNLRCRYCDTPDSLERTANYAVYGDRGVEKRPNPASAADAVALLTGILDRQAPIDALALTGGEPLVQAEFLADLLHAGQFPIPILLESNGVLPQKLRHVLPMVSIISMDIKPPSNTGEGPFWEEHAEFLRLCRGKDVYVKLLVDETTSAEDVELAAALVAEAPQPVPTFMQPIVDQGGLPTISAERLTHLYRVARQRLDAVRVLPQTHKLLGIR